VTFSTRIYMVATQTVTLSTTLHKWERGMNPSNTHLCYKDVTRIPHPIKAFSLKAAQWKSNYTIKNKNEDIKTCPKQQLLKWDITNKEFITTLITKLCSQERIGITSSNLISSLKRKKKKKSNQPDGYRKFLLALIKAVIAIAYIHACPHNWKENVPKIISACRKDEDKMIIKITDFSHINEKNICVYNDVHILLALQPPT
jgi:hypothetical protein